jgi:hypothetical protein
MARTAKSSDPKTQALLTFIDTIEVTGGIREQGDGTIAPIADGDWIDLARRTCRRATPSAIPRSMPADLQHPCLPPSDPQSLLTTVAAPQ